jgi:hypothetical protein
MKGRKGHKNTPEHNAKIAAAHRGKKLSLEHAEKSRKASLGRKQTPEEIEKRRLANTGKKRSPEFCERMRKLQANLTPEQKAARAEKTRQMNFNRDPVEKERLRRDLIARNKARKGEKREFTPVREAGSSDPIFYVYEHWRPDRGECFYVGKGYGQRAHDLTRGRNRWHKFITQKLSELGLVVEVRIIADSLTERQAFDMEVARIAFWKNDGADLCNITLGGDGPSGRKHTEEWKKAVSEKLKGREIPADTRAKISAALKGNKNGVGQVRTPEQIKAFVERCGPKTPEQIKRMSEARKGKPTPWLFTPESRAKSAAAQRGKHKSPEARRKMSLHKKTPEHREKLRQISLTWWANKKAERAMEKE